jgi:ribosomal protein S21
MQVKVRGTNIEGALRLFRRKVNDSGVLFQYKEKQYHEKRSTKKQRDLAAAKSRERKRQGSESKRMF